MVRVWEVTWGSVDLPVCRRQIEAKNIDEVLETARKLAKQDPELRPKIKKFKSREFEEITRVSLVAESMN